MTNDLKPRDRAYDLDDPAWIGINEAWKRADESPIVVEAAAESGELHGHRVSWGSSFGFWVFHVDALDAWTGHRNSVEACSCQAVTA
jgi:hypothetical protein